MVWLFAFLMSTTRVLNFLGFLVLVILSIRLFWTENYISGSVIALAYTIELCADRLVKALQSQQPVSIQITGNNTILRAEGGDIEETTPEPAAPTPIPS